MLQYNKELQHKGEIKIKCPICSNEMIEVESLGAGLADFFVSDDSSSIQPSIGIGTIHGEEDGAYYCQDCQKVIDIFDVK